MKQRRLLVLTAAIFAVALLWLPFSSSNVNANDSCCNKLTRRIAELETITQQQQQTIARQDKAIAQQQLQIAQFQQQLAQLPMTVKQIVANDPACRGPQGERGEKGEKGEHGERGEKGERGERGEQGLAGKDGRDGKDGVQGAQGPKGDIGAQGPQGPKGDIGAQGETGSQGPKGETGPQGERGYQGDKPAFEKKACRWVNVHCQKGHFCPNGGFYSDSCNPGEYVAGFQLHTWSAAATYNHKILCCSP